MNYTQLSTAIQDYTQNYETDFIANIPTFVEQAEQRIYNNVQIPALRKNVTGNCTDGNKYLACPEDYLAYRALSGMLTKQQIIQEACIIGGKRGGPIGGKKGKGRKQTQEWIEKRKLFGEKNGMYQQKHTKHASEKMTKHWQKYFQNEENKKNWIGSKNLRESNAKRFSENDHPSQQLWICEHCKKSGKSMGNYYRHHHDKCKLRNKVIHK